MLLSLADTMPPAVFCGRKRATAPFLSGVRAGLIPRIISYGCEGDVALTRLMAADFAEEHVRLNVIAPGGIATEQIVVMMGDRADHFRREVIGVPTLDGLGDIADSKSFWLPRNPDSLQERSFQSMEAGSRWRRCFENRECRGTVATNLGARPVRG